MHDRVLVDKAHLEVELGELRLAISAQVFVSVAARDLHVAIDARHHEQLLELLRALGQGVDHARLESAGHDEVARPFRCRLDEAGRLHLHEAMLVVYLADLLDEP